ncbi:MAG: glycerophosphodiester phosphodiesterase [Actinobacteria bacterium]|nr:glycerophosphodiester phosphodiesterase [Actinomycetota bacterium]
MLSSPFAVLQGATPHAIAHRGGAWEAPENSERAFQHAITLGFSFLETDIRATSDGVAVVFHDPSLDRTTDREGLIRELTWDTVSKARIHGREPILRLDELLESFPDVRFNLDVKEPNAIIPFVDTVRDSRAWDRICVGSFSHERLVRVRRLAGPRLATSLSPKEIINLRLRSLGLPVRWKPPKAACAQIPISFGAHILAESRFLAAAHELGWQVHVWTVDQPDVMSQLLELGVDGIMSDRPSTLKRVLDGLGLWPSFTPIDSAA